MGIYPRHDNAVIKTSGAKAPLPNFELFIQLSFLSKLIAIGKDPF